MRAGLFLWLFGYRVLRVKPEYGAVLADIIMKSHKGRVDICRKNDGEISVVLSGSEYDKIKEALENFCIEYDISEIYGFPALLSSLLKRPGIIAGIMIIIIMNFISHYFIWELEVCGNSSVKDEEILEELARHGCSPGAFIPAIDFKMLHNNVLLSTDKITWISVNMDGSYGRVEVRESLGDKNTLLTDEKAGNIVASEDGMIMLCEAVEGVASVEIGESVKKGQLLLSGVITVKEDGVRYERAQGKVMAAVNREINIEVPFIFDQEYKTGNCTKGKALTVFGKTFNISRKNGDKYSNCNKIEEDKQLSVFDSVTLPIWIHTTTFEEVLYETVTVDQDKAAAIGEKRLSEEIKELMKSCEILSMSTDRKYSDDGYFINCRLVCMKDIAEYMPLEMNFNSTEDSSGQETPDS